MKDVEAVVVKTEYGNGISKTKVKQLIVEEKERMKITRNEQIFVGIAVLKGIYIGIGGRKGITLPKQYEVIVRNAIPLFEFIHKSENMKSSHGYVKCLSEFADILNTKGVRINTISAFQHRRFGSNDEIASTLADMVGREHMDDRIINRQLVYVYTMNYISRIRSDELCAT